MKLKKKFKLRRIGDYGIAIPIGDKNGLNGNIIFNKTGRYVWELLENDISKQELILKMINKYNVDEKIVLKDIEDFLNICYANDLII